MKILVRSQVGSPSRELAREVYKNSLALQGYLK